VNMEAKLNEDQEDLDEFLLLINKAVDAIDQWKKRSQKVLVHCVYGDARSVVVVLAYMVKYCDFTLREAYYFVKEKRRSFSPPPIMLKQLVKFELNENGSSTLSSNDWNGSEVKNNNNKRKKLADIEDLINKWLDLARYLKASNPTELEDVKVSKEEFIENLIRGLMSDENINIDLRERDLNMDIMIPKIKSVALEWYNFQQNEDIIPIL